MTKRNDVSVSESGPDSDWASESVVSSGINSSPATAEPPPRKRHTRPHGSDSHTDGEKENRKRSRRHAKRSDDEKRRLKRERLGRQPSPVAVDDGGQGAGCDTETARPHQAPHCGEQRAPDTLSHSRKSSTRRGAEAKRRDVSPPAEDRAESRSRATHDDDTHRPDGRDRDHYRHKDHQHRKRRNAASPIELHVKEEPASDTEQERRQRRRGQERRPEQQRARSQERHGYRRREHSRDRTQDQHGDRSQNRHRNRSQERQRGQSQERHRPPSSGEESHHRQHGRAAEEDRHSRREHERKRRRRHHQNSPPAVRQLKLEPSHGRWDDEPRGNERGNGSRDAWGLREAAEHESKPVIEKERPNFGLSGKLVEDTNTVNGVVVKYSEPPEARKPKRRWRLYVFKGDETMPTLHIHRQSAFLMGRDRKVADIPIDHPSCSKQHAALQYRLTTAQRSDGTTVRAVRPYIIDLDSANGTFVNNQRIEAKRYVELVERDVVKFGFSSREYVLLHDSSQPDSSSGSGDE